VPFVARRLAGTSLMVVAVGLVVAACGFSPEFGEGAFGCADGGGCPPGLTCGTDGRCYTHPPDSSVDDSRPYDSSLHDTSLGDTSPHDSSSPDTSPADSSSRDTSPADTSSGCGAGPACTMGQRCVGDACVCDGMSCSDGCCSGTTCKAPPSASFCGTAGAGCSGCPSMRADGCSATTGLCQCGSGPACTAPKKCKLGACT
jgi:hypothetical protein